MILDQRIHQSCRYCSIVTDAVDFDPWLGAGASNPIMGDVSLNGVVQAFDASKILNMLLLPKC